MTTKIEWCDEVWNPTTGCTKVSAGCAHCYAERIANRFWGDRKFTDVRCHPERLDIPLRWKKPRRIFVDSMSDLFQKDVSDEFIHDVFSYMVGFGNTRHTFIILTKRHQRMWSLLSSNPMFEFWWGESDFVKDKVWLGVSVEDQITADERIPLLLQTPAALRFVSVEPMLEKIDIGMSVATCDCCDRWSSRWVQLNRNVHPDYPDHNAKEYIAPAGIYRAESNWHGALSVMTRGGLLGIKPAEFECLPKLDWVICGCESGPGARPMELDWVRSLRDQCVEAGVPFFLKQAVIDGKLVKMPELDGKIWAEYPEAK